MNMKRQICLVAWRFETKPKKFRAVTLLSETVAGEHSHIKNNSRKRKLCSAWVVFFTVT